MFAKSVKISYENPRFLAESRHWAGGGARRWTPGPWFSVSILLQSRVKPGHRRGEYTPQKIADVSRRLRFPQGEDRRRRILFFAAVFLHELGEVRKGSAGAASLGGALLAR